MDTTTAQADGMPSMPDTDFVYEAIKGAGKVGGYIQTLLADTIYYAGKYIAYLRTACADCTGVPLAGRGEAEKITVARLVRSDADLGDTEKREFYLSFGRDMVAMTKSGLESENLTIIDLSHYEL